MKDDILSSIPSYCILSGSRGFGIPTQDSDYDFYVPEKKWNHFLTWFFQFTKDRNLKVDSCITGHLSFRIGENHSDLFEFSTLFPSSKEEYQTIKEEEK